MGKVLANGGDAELLEFEAYVHGMSEREGFELLILGWAIEGERAPS